MAEEINNGLFVEYKRTTTEKNIANDRQKLRDLEERFNKMATENEVMKFEIVQLRQEVQKLKEEIVCHS